MTDIVAWPSIATPGEAQRVDPQRLVAAEFQIDGRPYFGREALREVVESGATLLARDEVHLCVAALNAAFVDCAALLAGSELDRAFEAVMDHPAQDRLMELVPHGSRHGPWISSVFLAAEYNALAAYPGRSAQEQIELIRSIESDLGDIERRLKQVPLTRAT